MHTCMRVRRDDGQFGFLLAFLNLAIGSTSSLVLALFFIFLGATRLPSDNTSMTKTTVLHHSSCMAHGRTRSLTLKGPPSFDVSPRSGSRH
jgi:hypothetical protein